MSRCAGDDYTLRIILVDISASRHAADWRRNPIQICLNGGCPNYDKGWSCAGGMGFYGLLVLGHRVVNSGLHHKE